MNKGKRKKEKGKRQQGAINARLFPFIFVALTGCGGPLVPAEGIVTLDGNPLADATIVLVPEGSGRGASALTDEDGKFILGTFQARDGAVPGKYKVVVTKADFGPPPPGSEPAIPTPGNAKIMETTHKRIKEQQLQSGVPRAYQSASTTPLHTEIKPGGDRNLKLEVLSRR